MIHMAFVGCNLSVIAQLLNANPGLPFGKNNVYRKEQFFTSVNSTVPAVTLPVAGYALTCVAVQGSGSIRGSQVEQTLPTRWWGAP
jgi:hypothetical protein